LPIIPAMASLLRDLRENPRAVRDPKRLRKNYVLAITEAQKALDRWCPEIGIKRITHHDLRHLFATTAIESGVDIPTVAKWLGHKDGGALAKKNVWPSAPGAFASCCAKSAILAAEKKAILRNLQKILFASFFFATISDMLLSDLLLLTVAKARKVRNYS